MKIIDINNMSSDIFINTFKNIFENTIAVSGTTNIKELAFTAPIFDDAKKYIVLAKDITTIDSDKIFIQKYVTTYAFVKIDKMYQ